MHGDLDMRMEIYPTTKQSILYFLLPGLIRFQLMAIESFVKIQERHLILVPLQKVMVVMRLQECLSATPLIII